MYTIAWTITIEKDITIPESFDFDSIEHITDNWKKTLFFFGETELKSSEDFIHENT